MYTMMNET